MCQIQFNQHRRNSKSSIDVINILKLPIYFQPYKRESEHLSKSRSLAQQRRKLPVLAAVIFLRKVDRAKIKK